MWTWHPEWWLAAVAVPGWLGLTAHEVIDRIPAEAHQIHHHHSGNGSAVAMHALMWAAMIAIMLPLIAPNVRFVALRSPGHRRYRATAEIAAGWLCCWIAAAVVLAFASWLADRELGKPVAITVFVVAAIWWHCSRLKLRSTARCHRTFAPPLDVRLAPAACRRFGARLGLDCVASCWALMAAMAAAGHSLLAVAPLFWVSWVERFRRPHHDPPTVTAICVIAGAGLASLAVMAWMGPG